MALEATQDSFYPIEITVKKIISGEKKTASRQENIAVWKGLMNRMQKKKLVPLPSVSLNSSSEVSH